MVNTLSILPILAWVVMWQTVQAAASEPTPYSVPGHASNVSVTVTPFSGRVTGGWYGGRPEQVLHYGQVFKATFKF